MKKLLIFIGYILLSNFSFAQINLGIKINPGFGYIKSSTINNLFISEKESDQNIVNFKSNIGAGFNIGLGGFLQYNFTSTLAIITEPSFNLLYSRIYINYKREVIDLNGSGNQIRISSIAKLRTLYFNLPIIVKYTFYERKKLFAIAGISLNVNTKPHLNSEETRIDAEYKFNNLTASQVSYLNTSATLNTYGTTQFNLILGIGKTFRRKLKNLSVDIRYNYPVTNTSMYNTDNETLSKSYNNVIFSSSENFNGPFNYNTFKKPNNFNLSVINLAIKYTIYKK